MARMKRLTSGVSEVAGKQVKRKMEHHQSHSCNAEKAKGKEKEIANVTHAEKKVTIKLNVQIGGMSQRPSLAIGGTVYRS